MKSESCKEERLLIKMEKSEEKQRVRNYDYIGLGKSEWFFSRMWKNLKSERFLLLKKPRVQVKMRVLGCNFQSVDQIFKDKFVTIS